MAQSAVIHEEFVYAGHNAVVNAVCYNRLQDCFVSCDDASLRLWRPARPASDLRLVALPPRTSNFIQAIEFVDARQMYVASALDGTLKIYDLELNEVTSVYAGRSAILSVAFDSRHGRLFTGGIGGCAAWSVRGKPLVGPESVLNPQYELAAAPAFFHYASVPGKSTIASSTSTAPPAKQSTSSPTDARASVVSAAAQPATGSKKRALRSTELAWVHNVRLNSEQTRLYAQAKHRVDVFSAADGHHIDTYADLFPPENGAITAFVVHEKTQYIVCGCINGCIFVLSVHPTSIVHVFKDHTMAVTGLAVHLSSHLIISSSLDGTVRLWDLEARRQAHRLDIRQPVYALGLLTPGATPCRFFCRVRSAVQIFTIRSAAKEHLASLSPISVLQRATFPTAETVRHSDAAIPGEKLSSTRHIELALLPPTRESATGDDGDDDDDDDASPANDTRQWIVAAGMDRTIRLFTGRGANEAPSFTWIPEEHALDVSGFALHAAGGKLFILLDSQKIVVVDITKKPRDDDSERVRPHRLIDMDAAPFSLMGNGSPQKTSQPQPQPQSQPTKRALAVAAVAGDKAPANSGSAAGPGSGGATNTAANPALRGAVRSLCCCYYPPIFRSTAPSAGVVGDATAQLRWFSRTFVNRRQQSKRDLKKLDDLGVSAAASASGGGATPPPLVQSDREWIVCGTEYGHLVFWHSGLTNSFQEAISLDAHDAGVVAIAASASSPLLVSLDASRRVHIWQFQPVFTLRQVVELNEQPTCFALAPTAELLLTGYEDGAVVLMHVGAALEQIETFAGADESHDAMVSGADFLDAKLLVLTASVDAVVKVWDQQKNLLRQIQIAMALTCLCFMNDDGDVMAGVPSGIVMLCKDDLLPDKLPSGEPGAASPSSARQRRLPIWLAGGGENKPGAEAADGRSLVPMKSDAETPSPSAAAAASVPKGRHLFQKKPTLSAVHFQQHEPGGDAVARDHDTASKGSDETSPVERVEAEEADADAEPAGASRVSVVPTKWKRRSYEQSLALLMGDASSPLLPPVLRATHKGSYQQQRATRPPSSRPVVPAKDPDWREVIMPSSPFHALARQSPRHRRHQPPSASSVIIAELKALARTGSPSSLRAPLPPPEPAADEPDEPAARPLGIGRADAPLTYCKHQAPVAPKAQTPRKLWNAIGGEDRRLLAVQRNLPSI